MPSVTEIIEDFQFNLKYQSKQFKRDSDHALKEAAKNQTKCKENMKKGNKEAAQIYAQQVISCRQQSAQYLQMAVRFDILGGALKTQQLNQQVAKEIAKVNQVVMQNLSPEQIVASSKTMTQFNALCEQMGVQNQVVQNSMGSNVHMPSVMELMSQVEAEVAVETSGQIKDAPRIAQPVAAAVQEDEELKQMQAQLAMK